MADENDIPWWQHALNAVAAGYTVHARSRDAAAQRDEAEREAKRRQRAKGGSRGVFDGAPRRRVKADPDEPCCDGPRRTK